jgi:hypothetical protein
MIFPSSTTAVLNWIQRSLAMLETLEPCELVIVLDARNPRARGRVMSTEMCRILRPGHKKPTQSSHPAP